MLRFCRSVAGIQQRVWAVFPDAHVHCCAWQADSYTGRLTHDAGSGILFCLRRRQRTSVSGEYWCLRTWQTDLSNQWTTLLSAEQPTWLSLSACKAVASAGRHVSLGLLTLIYEDGLTITPCAKVQLRHIITFFTQGLWRKLSLSRPALSLTTSWLCRL